MGRLLHEARSRIRELAHLHAFISVTAEAGSGPLVAVKDLVDVRGTVTTAGGVILPYEPATKDAPLVESMRDHGCVVLGKTNLHEFAFGVTSANPHYGDVLNPHDPARFAGGSSGGSAVAVAAGMCDWAVGSDTGGSIRIPAALCGVVGFKPTLGSISTLDVVPLSRSLDTIGPLAPDVRTAARAAEMMGMAGPLVPDQNQDPSSLRLAVPEGWAEGLDEATAATWDRVSAGLPTVALPDRRRFVDAGVTILLFEAASFHRGWVEKWPEKYAPDVLAHLRRGLTVPAGDYEAALEDMDRLRAETAAAMNGLDAVLLPASRIVAPLTTEPDVRDKLSGLTRPFNVTGQPVVVLPAAREGLPVGIQVVGHHGQDAALLKVAAALEAAWDGARAIA